MKSKTIWQNCCQWLNLPITMPKNTDTDHALFKLNYKYYARVFFENKTNFYLESRFTNKLVDELKELIEISHQNLLYI